MTTSAASRQILEGLISDGVVPVVRTRSARLAARAVAWLGEAGFGTFEITITTPDGLALIEELARDKKLTIGAGTVVDDVQAVACINAGAKFIVSPALIPDMVAPCQEAAVPCVLGAATPSEVLTASRAGADAIKIFPVSSLGGIAHVKALKAVYPRLLLAPTGGVGVDEIGAYLIAGSAFVGVGGRLVDVAALESGDKDAIIRAGQSALAQVQTARR